MWLEGHLAELRRIIDRHADAGLISTRSLEVADDTSFSAPVGDVDGRIYQIDYFLEASRNIGIINASSAALRREVFQELGGFANFRSGPDLEYWARVALNYPVVISDRMTCIYFRNTNGNMELLARKKILVSTPVETLRDLSPSVHMICSIADRQPEYWRNQSIVTYVNSRVYNGVKGALYRGELTRAREISSLFIGRLSWKWYMTKLAMLFPNSVLRTILLAFKKRHSFSNT
jgi:hypothetical protein